MPLAKVHLCSVCADLCYTHVTHVIPVDLCGTRVTLVIPVDLCGTLYSTCAVRVRYVCGQRGVGGAGRAGRYCAAHSGVTCPLCGGEAVHWSPRRSAAFVIARPFVPVCAKLATIRPSIGRLTCSLAAERGTGRPAGRLRVRLLSERHGSGPSGLRCTV